MKGSIFRPKRSKKTASQFSSFKEFYEANFHLTSRKYSFLPKNQLKVKLKEQWKQFQKKKKIDFSLEEVENVGRKHKQETKEERRYTDVSVRDTNWDKVGQIASVENETIVPNYLANDVMMTSTVADSIDSIDLDSSVVVSHENEKDSLISNFNESENENHDVDFKIGSPTISSEIKRTREWKLDILGFSKNSDPIIYDESSSEDNSHMTTCEQKLFEDGAVDVDNLPVAVAPHDDTGFSEGLQDDAIDIINLEDYSSYEADCEDDMESEISTDGFSDIKRNLVSAYGKYDKVYSYINHLEGMDCNENFNDFVVKGDQGRTINGESFTPDNTSERFERGSIEFIENKGSLPLFRARRPQKRKKILDPSRNVGNNTKGRGDSGFLTNLFQTPDLNSASKTCKTRSLLFAKQEFKDKIDDNEDILGLM